MIHSAYNLCDIDIRFYSDPEAVAADVAILAQRGSDGLYAGSYFCANYFLAWAQRAAALAEAARAAALPLVVVVPVPSGRTIQAIKETLLTNRNLWAEVVVNDYGMLQWCSENLSCPIHLGRLFMRQPRDPRYPDLQNSTFRVPFSLHSLETYRDRYGVCGIEMEGFGQAIDAENLPSDLTLSLHRPWFMISCDFICEDASLPKSIEQKFRADQPCHLECSGTRYDYALQNAFVTKVGRGLYTWQESDPVCTLPQESALRYIEYYPFSEEVSEP